MGRVDPHQQITESTAPKLQDEIRNVSRFIKWIRFHLDKLENKHPVCYFVFMWMLFFIFGYKPYCGSTKHPNNLMKLNNQLKV